MTCIHNYKATHSAMIFNEASRDTLLVLAVLHTWIRLSVEQSLMRHNGAKDCSYYILFTDLVRRRISPYGISHANFGK
jgi:hypothetical protein